MDAGAANSGLGSKLPEAEAAISAVANAGLGQIHQKLSSLFHVESSLYR